MVVPFPVQIADVARDGGGESLVVDDPSSARAIAEFGAADRRDVDEAVAAAAAAAPGWRCTGAWRRAMLCRKVADLIRARRERLLEIGVHDAGLPVRLAAADVEAAARYFEYYAAVAETVAGETLPDDGASMTLLAREPWGVCAIVLPFNLPLQLVARDVAPALAMGNAVVVKPAELAPYGPLALIDLIREAGTPPGVANAVAGGATTGDHLVRHRDVDHITFTGSRRTGSAIMAAAAQRIVPTTIELGGKSPHVVFADADLDAATRAIVRGCMPAAGQACSAGTRVLVSRSCHAELCARLRAALEALSVGPAETDPDVGPLISARQRGLVEAAVAMAVDAGAHLAAGGRLPTAAEQAGGHYVPPTLVDSVDPAATLAREEVFGPVVAMIEFADEGEATAIANGTDYGLVAAVWTRDVSRALGLARALQAGQVHINGYAVGGNPQMPFGGYKRSGVGRVKGVAGALEYTQLKTIAVALT